MVIGGGLAGLAASVALAEAGWRVRVFEQRPFLGGRATSYVLPDGEHVDNCQHVTLGCCTNLEDFYRRAGSADKIKFFDRLVFLDPQGRRGEIGAGFLPAPFHMTGSFATFQPVTMKDKLAIARAMFEIVRGRGHTDDLDEAGGITMAEWLRRRKQTRGAIERFWRVVLVSALDEELERTDARYGVEVFWKAFLSNRQGYRMGVPIVPLADLYAGCKEFIERRGGEVQLRATVRALNIVEVAEADQPEKGANLPPATAAASTLAGVLLDGREEVADAYIFALPHGALTQILPEKIKQQYPELKNIENIHDAPITGVHFWFDREVMREPFVTLLDTSTQWIFNKTALYGGGGKNRNCKGQYLQLVISASYDLLQKPRQEIIDLCLKEVRQALPAARSAQLMKATVIKEAAATFSPEPGVDRWRPAQATAVKGMFLAGDWTATGWPSTMEGAVRSGYLAAEAVLRAEGTPRQFLQADLQRGGVVSLLGRKKSAI